MTFQQTELIEFICKKDSLYVVRKVQIFSKKNSKTQWEKTRGKGEMYLLCCYYLSLQIDPLLGSWSKNQTFETDKIAFLLIFQVFMFSSKLREIFFGFFFYEWIEIDSCFVLRIWIVNWWWDIISLL